MARNPLQPGEIGKIRTMQVQPGLWRADAVYCDHSGARGRCRKSGRTASAARRALADELKERLERDNPNGLVTPTSHVNEAVEIFLTNRMDDARNGIGRANPRSVKAGGDVRRLRPRGSRCGSRSSRRVVNLVAERGRGRPVLASGDRMSAQLCRCTSPTKTHVQSRASDGRRRPDMPM